MCPPSAESWVSAPGSCATSLPCSALVPRQPPPACAHTSPSHAHLAERRLQLDRARQIPRILGADTDTDRIRRRRQKCLPPFATRIGPHSTARRISPLSSRAITRAPSRLGAGEARTSALLLRAPLTPALGVSLAHLKRRQALAIVLPPAPALSSPFRSPTLVPQPTRRRRTSSTSAATMSRASSGSTTRCTTAKSFWTPSSTTVSPNAPRPPAVAPAHFPMGVCQASFNFGASMYTQTISTLRTAPTRPTRS